MATLSEYFTNDFKDLSIDNTIKIGGITTTLNTNEKFEFSIDVKLKIIHESKSSSRLLCYYIPECHATKEICEQLILNHDNYIKSRDGIQTIMGYTGDKTIGTHKAVYSKRAYIYSETQLSEEQLKQLQPIIHQKDLYVTFRSNDYVIKVEELQKPFAFISHDSRDKELVARPVAQGLNSKLCFVWYDEYSLKVGDRLRESIEKGIKEAKKCILIITSNFLSNPGWTKTEFDSIFTREVLFHQNIVLPIWFQVDKFAVYEYSPSLADKVALIWPEKDKLPELEYKTKVEEKLSELHLAIMK
jgi:hypothetical protein